MLAIWGPQINKDIRGTHGLSCGFCVFWFGKPATTTEGLEQGAQSFHFFFCWNILFNI